MHSDADEETKQPMVVDGPNIGMLQEGVVGS